MKFTSPSWAFNFTMNLEWAKATAINTEEKSFVYDEFGCYQTSFLLYPLSHTVRIDSFGLEISWPNQ
jgi:hypothetical protein